MFTKLANSTFLDLRLKAINAALRSATGMRIWFPGKVARFPKLLLAFLACLAAANPATVLIQSKTGGIGMVTPLNVVTRNITPNISMMSPSVVA